MCCFFFVSYIVFFFMLLQGRAMGGGAELTTACDHRVMAQDASVCFRIVFVPRFPVFDILS